MTLSIPDKRGPSFTVIAPMSSHRGLLYYDVFQGSNNASQFAKFIARLKQRSLNKTMLVMDNLSVHKAKVVRSLFDTMFQQVFLPPYSCSLNPVEHLWLVVKQKWRRSMHQLSYNVYTDEQERVLDIKERIQ